MIAPSDLQVLATLELYLRAGGDIVAKLNERDVVETLNALVRVQADPSLCSHIIQPFLERFQSLMASRTASVVASARAVYLSSKLGHDPGDQWAEKFFESTADSLHEFTAQHLAINLYSWATLGRLPPQFWLDRYWMASSGLFSTFKSQNFSNCVYACAVLGAEPPAEWWLSFFNDSRGSLSTFEAQHFSNTLWAFAKLGQTPSEDWMCAYFGASKERLGLFCAQHLSNVIYACAELGITPPGDWLSESMARSCQIMATFAPQDFSITIWAYAKLGRLPPVDWLLQFFDLSAGRLSSFKEQELSNTLWACSELRCCPPQAWLRHFSICCNAALDKNNLFSAQEVANMLFAGAVLQQPLSSELRRKLFERLLTTHTDGKQQPPTLQAYANVLIAAAFLDLLDVDRAILQQVWDRAQRIVVKQHGGSASAPVATVWADENPQFRLDLHQLLLVSLAAPLAADDGTAAGLFQFPSDSPVRKVALESWEAQARSDINTTSMLEAKVAAGFRRILSFVSSGLLTATPLSNTVRMEIGYFCTASLRMVDIVIISSGAGASTLLAGGAGVERRIAVEVDGPSHFIHDLESGRVWIDGSTALRNRCLALAGWEVVSIPFHEWDGLGGDVEREDEYLRGKLSSPVAGSG